MKTKIVHLCLLLLFTTGVSYGNTVNEPTAKKAAINFLLSVGIDSPGLSGITTAYTSVTGINGAPFTGFYIFNAPPSCFVIISASDVVQPVLGYSTENIFSIPVSNTDVQYWLNEYHQNIAHKVMNNISASLEVHKQWNDLLTRQKTTAEKNTHVLPLTTTAWNQYPLYNDLCPYDFLYRRPTLTGCIATAMAQLMKYWNWPVSGCGSHSYPTKLYGVQSVDFSASKYQWANMSDTLSGPDSAVAKLMYDAGVSVNTEYGLNSSISYMVPEEDNITNVVSYALKTYFHYKPSLKALSRQGTMAADSFTAAQWMNMLRSELESGRPVLYGGYNGNNDPHGWVCDGYNNSGNNYLFHFNWGWGGKNNGYFSIDNAENFDSRQHAVFGIQPDTYPVFNDDLQVAGPLQTTSSPARYGQPFSVSASIINKGSSAASGDFCAQVFDTSGQLVGTVQTIPAFSLQPGANTGMLTFATGGMFQLAAGIYSIHIAYRSPGTTDWRPVGNNGDITNYTVMGIANDTDMMLYKPFEIATDTLIHGRPAVISAFITNIGRARFTGNLDLSLYDIATGVKAGIIASQNDVLINTYAARQFTFTNDELRVPPGKYILMLQHQYNDTGAYCITGAAWAPNPVVVTVGGIKDYDSHAVYVYPNPASNTVYIDPYYNVIQELRITDIRGCEMLKMTDLPQNRIISVPVKNFPAGIYFLQYKTPAGMHVHKINIYN